MQREGIGRRRRRLREDDDGNRLGSQ